MTTPVKLIYWRRVITIFVLVCFFVTNINVSFVRAQEFKLPAPGVMVGLSPEFSPAVLKGIKLDPQNPFRFHFFVDRGDTPTRGQVPPTRGHVAEAPIGDRNVSRAPASVRQEDPSRLPSETGLNVKATQRNEPNDVEHIYQQYLKAFKKGVYNYIKEDSVIARSPQGDEAISERTTIPRKYFSGGAQAYRFPIKYLGVEQSDYAMSVLKDSNMVGVDGDVAMIDQNSVLMKSIAQHIRRLKAVSAKFNPFRRTNEIRKPGLKYTDFLVIKKRINDTLSLEKISSKSYAWSTFGSGQTWLLKDLPFWEDLRVLTGLPIEFSLISVPLNGNQVWEFRSGYDSCSFLHQMTLIFM
jgi:hypothetical protein